MTGLDRTSQSDVAPNIRAKHYKPNVMGQVNKHP